MAKKNPLSGKQRRKEKTKDREDFWKEVQKEQAKKEKAKKKKAKEKSESEEG